MYSISFQDDISMMPRERLMREGAEKLSNQELLSIFLRTGNKKETVFQVSQRILSSISSLNDLKHLTLQELQTISGIGEKKAQDILDYREANGGFKSVDDLKNISGIGDKTLEKLKDLVSVD